MLILWFRWVNHVKSAFLLGKIHHHVLEELGLNEPRHQKDLQPDDGQVIQWGIPSGKHTKKTMENHKFFLGKLTISMAIFNSELFVYQRV